MQRTEIDSKKIRSWAYDAASEVLEVEYVWGSIIRYFEVLPALVAMFEESESKGGFLSKQIEYRHARRKLAEGEDQTGPLELPADTAAGRPTPARSAEPDHDYSEPLNKRRRVRLL
jgi:hypothetical protein